jgi:hypothetical protein
MSNDSLIIELEAQGYSVANARSVYGAGSELASGEVSYVDSYREASAEQMFGEASVLESYDAVTPLEPTLISSWLFQSLIIVGLVAYLYMLLRSWRFMGTIWQGVLFRSSERRMRDEGGELPLERFKLSASVLGLVLMALVVVRLVDMSLQSDAAIYSSGMLSLAPIYALFAILLFVAWHYLLHKLIGVVTRSEVVDGAWGVTAMNFVRLIVILYPLVAIWLLAPNDMLDIWSVVLGIVMSIMVIIYLKDTFVLFVGKKISILNWILYLCAAILLPISFVFRIIPQLF